jgi:hypothetical protein
MEKIILKKQEFEAVSLELTKADAKFTEAKRRLNEYISNSFGAKITKNGSGEAVASVFMKPYLSCNSFVDGFMKLQADVHNAYVKLHRLRAKNRELYFQVRDYLTEDASHDQGMRVEKKAGDQIPAISEAGQLTVKLTRGETKCLVDKLIDTLTNSTETLFVVDFSDKITVIPQVVQKEAE